MLRSRTPLVLTVLVVASLASACSNSAGTADARSSASASSRPAPPLMLGTERYVSPCRLLTLDDVTSLVPDLGPYATFSQKIVETGRTSSEMAATDRTLGGAVKTSCTYFEDDDSVDTLMLDVDQYVSTASATRAWQNTKDLGEGKLSRRARADKLDDSHALAKLAKQAEDKDGGFLVPGLDRSILYVPGRGTFIAHRGNLLLTATVDGALGKSEAGVRKLFSAVFDHLEERSRPQSPVSASWQQSRGWPHFVDPCSAFDATAMQRTTGHRGDGTAEVESTLRDPEVRVRRNADSPAFQAVSNKCSRMSYDDPKYWSGSAEIFYKPPGVNAALLFQTLPIKQLFPPGPAQHKYVAQNLVTEGALKAVDVPGADRAWFLDLTVKGLHLGWVMAAKGDDVVLIKGDQPGDDSLDRQPVPQKQLVAGAARVLSRLG